MVHLRTLLTLCIVLLALACAEDRTAKVNLHPEEEIVTQEEIALAPVEMDATPFTIAGVAGVYVANLPCPDCVSMEYKLELLADGGYTESIVYKGKSAEPSQTIGKFTINEQNHISLGKPQPAFNLLAKTKAGLLLLDEDGSPFRGANEKRYQLLPLTPKKTSNLNETYFAQGIEFYATGSAPDWQLLLDFNSGFKLTLPDGKVTEFPMVEPESLNDEATRMSYTTTGPAGALTVILEMRGLCQNNQTGDLMDCSITATYKNAKGKTTAYSGCGNFVTYPELFTTTWQLAYFNKVAATRGQYSEGIPTLRFNRNQREFGGIDGCNDIAGQYYLLGDKIMFFNFASTAKSCPKIDESREFNFAIQGNMYSMVVYEGQLTLTNLKNTLVFTKK